MSYSGPKKPRDWSPLGAIMVVAAVVLGAGFVVPIASAGEMSNWPKFLYKYQTILAGMLAVLAAFITVTEMTRADQESERRHRELIELTLRSEFRTIQRVVDLHMFQMRRIFTRIDDAREDFGAANPPTFLKSLLGGYRTDLEDLLKILDSESFNQGADLFDGGAYANYRNIRYYCSLLLSELETFQPRKNAEVWTGNFEIVRFFYTQLTTSFGTLIAYLDGLNASIPENLFPKSDGNGDL